MFDSLILIRAPGSAFPTAGIDHLVITPFGMFVTETKHWAGAVTREESADMLILPAIDGQRLARTSPMKHNAAKVRFLTGLLPPRLWIVEGLGVFSHEAGTVDPTLPAALLERDELYRYLRMCQQRFALTGTGALACAHARQRASAAADMRPQARRTPATHSGRPHAWSRVIRIVCPDLSSGPLRSAVAASSSGWRL
ncbi:nuclease-related domain-containing protein [Paraburkholderia panacisoli]|uniref:nuclease-related domain-containing protein n=1 Tax=Paraburkholderia panacisoli TaxID=2603818 RepID=UPI001FEC46F8|nr:nuclease-related domain-containing protein [Paraburkholderia panacisoli]